MLLERESSLASLAEYAREARQGEGRLVLVAGEAGAGKSALVEQFQADVPDARWYWGSATACSPHVPSDRSSTLPANSTGRCSTCATPEPLREELFRALLNQLNESRDAECRRHRGRPLGRRGDARPAAVPRPPHTRLRGALARHLSRRRAGRRRSASRRARRTCHATLDQTRRAAVAVGGRRPILAGGSGLEADELYRMTGGNPFYVTEVVRAGVGEVPPSARDAVLARVARLGSDSRDVLDAAALHRHAHRAAAGRSRSPRARPRLSTTYSPPACSWATARSCGSGTRSPGWRWNRRLPRIDVASSTHASSMRCAPAAATTTPGMAFHAEGAATVRPCSARRPARRRERPSWHHIAKRRRSTSGPCASRPARIRRRTRPTLRRAGLRGVADRPLAGRRRRATSTRWRCGARRETGCAKATRCASSPALCGGCAAGMRRSAPPSPRSPRSNHSGRASNWPGRTPISRPADARRRPPGAIESGAAGAGDCRTIGVARGAQRRAQHRRMRRDGRGSALGEAAAPGSGDRRRGWHAGAGRPGVREPLQQPLRRTAIRRSRTIPQGGPRLLRRPRHQHVLHLPARRADQHAGEAGPVGRVRRDERGSAAAVGSSPINRINPLTSLGTIRARKGEPGAWEYLDEAIAAADGSGEPRWVVRVRLARAEAQWLDGQASAAEREVELADDASADCDAWQRGAIGVWLQRTNSTRAARGEVAEPVPAPPRGRLAAGRADVDGPGLPVRCGHGAARQL